MTTALRAVHLQTGRVRKTQSVCSAALVERRSIGIEERRIAARPLMQLVVYDGPIVIDEPPATPSFSCQHRPCCADRQAHVQLIRVNAARRQEVWREKQRKEALPRALPPPPLASRVPRSSGVGRGTKMPAARQVCCVRHVVSCDIVPALLSRLSGGHVANECKRRSAWSSVGRPTAKECHTPVAATEKSHVWTRIRLSVKCTCCFVLLCLHTAFLIVCRGGHVANGCKRRSAWSSVGRPTAKECHTPVAAKEKSHVLTRIRLSVKCTCSFHHPPPLVPLAVARSARASRWPGNRARSRAGSCTCTQRRSGAAARSVSTTSRTSSRASNARASPSMEHAAASSAGQRTQMQRR